MNITNNNKTKKLQHHHNKNMGGTVETSGGFGCLFIPSLKCKNKTSTKKTNRKMVSKLMTKRHAIDEYNIISSVKSILKKITLQYKYVFWLCLMQYTSS
jgi:hypothetical protein